MGTFDVPSIARAHGCAVRAWPATAFLHFRLKKTYCSTPRALLRPHGAFLFPSHHAFRRCGVPLPPTDQLSLPHRNESCAWPSLNRLLHGSMAKSKKTPQTCSPRPKSWRMKQSSSLALIRVQGRRSSFQHPQALPRTICVDWHSSTKVASQCGPFCL